MPTPNHSASTPMTAKRSERAITSLVKVSSALCVLFTIAGVSNAQTTLELPLETGNNAPKTTVETKAPAKPAAKPTSKARTSSGSGRVTALPLPSRGNVTRTPVRQAPQQAPKVLAQLGLVIADKLEVRVGLETNSQILSTVEKGTHLAVVQENDEFYGVLMVNNTIGWVPKSSMELIDYKTEVSVPAPKQEEPKAQNPQEALTQGLSQVQQSVLREAFTYLGVPYVWAGNTRSGLDCSAFVKNVFATVGVTLPRHSGDQITVGRAVQGPDLQPGDRLYFDMKRVGRISHTGIYIGNGLFIHASSGQHKVAVDSIFKKSFYNALVCARRDFG